MRRLTRLSVLVLAALLAVGAGCKKDKGGGDEKEKKWTPIDPKGMTSKHVALVLGKKITLAAVGNARGLSKTKVDQLMADARTLAGTVGAKLPDLPEKKGETAKDMAHALGYVLRDAGKEVARALREKGSPADAATFEVAVKTLLVLPLYAPGDSMGLSMAQAITRALDKAVLPQDGLLRGMVAKIEAKAPEAEVREAAEKGLAEAEAGLASAGTGK